MAECFSLNFIVFGVVILALHSPCVKYYLRIANYGDIDDVCHLLVMAQLSSLTLIPSIYGC